MEELDWWHGRWRSLTRFAVIYRIVMCVKLNFVNVYVFFYCASDWFASRKLKITVSFISVYNETNVSIKSSGLSMHTHLPHAFWELFPSCKKRMWWYLQGDSLIVTPKRLEKKTCSVATFTVRLASLFVQSAFFYSPPTHTHTAQVIKPKA